MANRLYEKVALVTGAASGMGKAIALSYLSEGARVFGVDINEERLRELTDEAAGLGYGDALSVKRCNIANEDDCRAAVEGCVNVFGTMNVLSHNAGICDNFTMVHEMDIELWNRMISVNLTGSMFVTKAALRYFLDNEIKASIVMITSNAAFESATGGPAYCASKAGANALMKSIAFEYARKGIRCNSICPGPVGTNITESMGDWADEGSDIHNFTGYNAHQIEWTGIQYANPEDVAPLAVYLASDESGFMNSSSVVIDGGVCLSR